MLLGGEATLPRCGRRAKSDMKLVVLDSGGQLGNHKAQVCQNLKYANQGHCPQSI